RTSRSVPRPTLPARVGDLGALADCFVSLRICSSPSTLCFPRTAKGSPKPPSPPFVSVRHEQRVTAPSWVRARVTRPARRGRSRSLVAGRPIALLRVTCGRRRGRRIRPSAPGLNQLPERRGVGHLLEVHVGLPGGRLDTLCHSVLEQVDRPRCAA